MNNNKGFTLIELMLVVSIIGVLASIAIPNFFTYELRAYRSEGFVLIDSVKKNINEFFDYRGFLPRNNEQAGVPAPDHIKGKYVKRITVTNGVISVAFKKIKSNKSGQHEINPIVLTPAISKENPTSPLIWTLEKV